MYYLGRLKSYSQTLHKAGKVCQENTLAYYKHLEITSVESFITLGPGHRELCCGNAEINILMSFIRVGIYETT